VRTIGDFVAQMSRRDQYKFRDFAIYLFALRTDDLNPVAEGFNVSVANVKRILRKVDNNYADYQKLYWDTVHEYERQNDIGITSKTKVTS
jgi:hypothetical protein